MEASDAMGRVGEMRDEASAPRGRAFLHVAILFAPTFLATLLILAPNLFPASLALVLGIIFVFFLAGYLLETILFSHSRGGGNAAIYTSRASVPYTLTRLPIYFVFSLAVWAIPATALQILGANWFAFRVVFGVILWVLTLAAWRRTRKTNFSFSFATNEFGAQLVLALLCLVIAFLVARGTRDADDWGYLQITQQLIGSNPFQILAASEVRYSIRYAFHVWIFLQAYLADWLNADAVHLLREWLPVMLSPLALVSFYTWGKTFFGRANAALLAVMFQLFILVTFANADGWGRGFFARSAQDKFLVWLIVLPVAFSFSWNFLREGKLKNWFAYGVSVIAGLWVHPVSLFLIVIALAGFALFNLISRAPFPRRRWLLLALASLPALLLPLVIRATTLASVFTVNTPDVAAYVRLSEGRLLFQPPFYIADPALLANPTILFSLALLVLFTARLRTDPRVQFLWGSTLLPLALVFNPFTARILGEMLTPWQLWRVTWLVPVAFLLTEAFFQLRAIQSSRRVVLAVGLLVAAIAAFGLSNLNLARSFNNFTQDHALDAPVEDILRALQKNLDAPANVLLPRKITRYAPAYTHRAIVLSNDAQKPEDTRGQQIDRFYDPHADPKFLDAFLNFWEIEYAVVENDSLQDNFLKTHSRAQFLYRNGKYTLYQIRSR